MIDPLERWRELGLPDKPDYAGLLTYAALPYTHDPADLAGVDVAIVGAPMDDLTSDRPGPIRSSRDPRRELPCRDLTSRRRSMRW